MPPSVHTPGLVALLAPLLIESRSPHLVQFRDDADTQEHCRRYSRIAREMRAAHGMRVCAETDADDGDETRWQLGFGQHAGEEGDDGRGSVL